MGLSEQLDAIRAGAAEQIPASTLELMHRATRELEATGALVTLLHCYQGFGLDLPAYHQESSWTLPMPARFVVDQQGIVRFAEGTADYTGRPEPAQTLEVHREIVS